MANLSEIINEVLDFDTIKRAERPQTLGDIAKAQRDKENRLEKAKARGASEQELNRIKNSYGFTLDDGKKTADGKDFTKAGTDMVATIANINTTKRNLWKLMVYFCELTGANGGETKMAAIKKTLDDLKKYTDTLIMYEHRVSAKTVKAVGKELRAKLNRIDLNTLDWDEKTVPTTSDVTNVKTGKFIEKNGKRTNEKYAEIEGVDENDAKSGNIDVSKLQSTKVIGKARPNADIYEDLYPYIREFSKFNHKISMQTLDQYRDRYDSAKDGSKEQLEIIRQVIGQGFILDDLLSDKGKYAPAKETPEAKQARETDYKNRRELAKKVIDNSSDEDIDNNKGAYGAFRNSEKAKDANKGSNFGSHANAMAKKNEDKLRKELGVEKEKISNANGQSGDVPSLTKAFKGDKKKIFNAKFEDLKKKGEGSCVIYNIGQGVVDTTNALIIMAEKFLTDASATTTTTGAIFSSDELKNNAFINYNGQKFYMFKTDRNSPYAKMCKDPENKGFAESLDRKGGELKQKVKQIFSSSSVETDGPFNY